MTPTVPRDADDGASFLLQPAASDDNLRGRTIRGGLAKVVAQGAGFVLRIGSLMILARLLEPRDFGLVAMVTVVTGLFGLFKDAGLSMITVQRERITTDQLSSLFWLNMAVGTFLGVLSAAAAPLLVAFYDEPRLFWVAVALGSAFIFNAAGVQHAALLQRQMRFAVLAAIDVISISASVIVGVGMATAGYGYWALVGMAVSPPIATTVGAWMAARWVPGPPRRGGDLLSMMRFGGTVSLNVLVVYFAYNLDKLLLGRFAGAEVLGVYGRAYQLVNIPTDNLNNAVGGVALSALSRLQTDDSRFRGFFLKAYSLVLTVTVPVTVACGLFADDIVQVLLGPKWSEATAIFRFLAPTILAFALINPVTWLLFARGSVGRSLKMALVIAPLVIASYVIGLPFGAQGVAIGFSAMMCALTVPLIVWALHESPVTPRDAWQTAKPLLGAAAVAAPMAFVAVSWFGGRMSPLPRLLTEVGILSVTYVWLLFYPMKQKDFYLTLLDDLKRGA